MTAAPFDYASLTCVAVHKYPGHVALVELNRPNQGNAFNRAMFRELKAAFEAIHRDTDVRCVVLAAAGKNFSYGLDLKDPEMMTTLTAQGEDPARVAHALRDDILFLQQCVSAVEKTWQPVICCLQGIGVGAAVDLASAACIRLATRDAWLSIKEVDIGIVADVGTIPRVMHAFGNASLVRDLIYTGRRFEANEALACGFVQQLFDTREELVNHALSKAKLIASKSPVALSGIKHHLNWARGRPVEDSLDRIALWNAAFLQTRDVQLAAQASLKKGSQPNFPKL